MEQHGVAEDEVFSIQALVTDGGSGRSVSTAGNDKTGILGVLDVLPVVYLSDNKTALPHLLNALHDGW